MYRFVRCITNPRCPDTQGWYLVLRPVDLDALMKLHKGVSAFYYHKFGTDPHIKPDTAEAVLKNPVRLAALWLGSVEKFLSSGVTLVINRCGGMVPLDSVVVVAELESEQMHWPKDFDPAERITISRWPEAKHYYLSSNVNRVFAPPKYAHYKDARRVAEMYTDKIKDSGC